MALAPGDNLGRYEIAVLISSGGGVSAALRGAAWRQDGRELFYFGKDGRLMAAEVWVRNGVLEVGRVQRLFGGFDAYDVSADGQRLLVALRDDHEPAPPSLTLIQNWTSALR